MASSWAIWEIKKTVTGFGKEAKASFGKVRWEGTLRDLTLVQAGKAAEAMMIDKNWYGVGVRRLGELDGSGWQYVSFRDGPTDFSLLKPWRKKEYDGPKLFEGDGHERH